MHRAILIETTETPPPGKGEHQNAEEQAESAKEVYITIYTL